MINDYLLQIRGRCTFFEKLRYSILRYNNKLFCLEGFNMTLNPNDYGLSRQLWCRTYREPICVQKYKEILKDNMVVFDIGSNIGHYPLIALNSCNLDNILCFEPHPISFNYLKFNLKDYNNKQLFNAAVVDDNSKKIYLNTNKGWFNTASLSDKGLLVDSINLNELNIKPDIVRMDLEGYEYKLIPSLKPILKDCSYIFFELHPLSIEQKYGGSSYDLFKVLIDCNLKPFFIIRSYGPFLEKGYNCDLSNFYDILNDIGVHEYYRGGLGLFFGKKNHKLKL